MMNKKKVVSKTRTNTVKKNVYFQEMEHFNKREIFHPDKKNQKSKRDDGRMSTTVDSEKK